MMEGKGEKLSPEQHQEWWHEAGRWQLRQLLFWRWDPIGVNDDFPFTVDEYDSYADPIASLLGREADVVEIAAFLQGVEEDAMGLGRGDGPGDHYREVARLIADWHRNSISHWLAR
jgi:hypothetical protein